MSDRSSSAFARSRPDTVHLGCIVYFWGEREQDRLLCECLGPLGMACLDRDPCHGFWFMRHDIRGPHIFAIFSARATVIDELRGSVSATLAAYIERSPSHTEFSAELLAERHAACRDKFMCAMDREPGMASNNSFHLCDHPPDGYPFALAHGSSVADELWRFVSELSCWALSRLSMSGATTTAPAIRWLVRFERALRTYGLSATDYWHYHAATLCMDLDDRIRPGGRRAEDVLARLGPRNLQIFRQLWREGLDAPAPGAGDAVAGHDTEAPDPKRLVELILADGDEPIARHHPLMREVVHVLLNQLGLPVSAQIPIVLFAWLRPDGEIP